MTADEERYVHYSECCESLNRAWRILQELQTARQTPVINNAAFRFALIEYAKPYKGSVGTHRRRNNAYKLDPPSLSPNDLILHQKILDLRDQVLAHSDLTLKDAIVSVARYGGRASIIIGGNSEPQMPDIVPVIQLIEHTLEIMYVEQARLLEILAN